MSSTTDDDQIVEPELVVETLQRWYPVPILAAVVGFLLWTRTRAYDQFVRDDQVYFGGNDAFYHFRATMYSVENWPQRLYGDPWTLYPYGTNVGHFGTLFDQVVATAALIVGLGDPTSRQVAIVAVLTPAVLGALVVIPVYFLAKGLSGSRFGGVTAAVILALLPQGAWVSRSTVGFYDHHVGEVLMMAIAVFAMVYTTQVVRRERPVIEQLEDRDWDGLGPTVRASVLAGIAIALYQLTWPPGVVLVGIFGLFFVVSMSITVAQGRSPEHLAFAGTLSMLVAFVLVLPWIQTLEPDTTTLSSVQLLASLAVAGGCASMGALARYWDRRGLQQIGYPAAIGALGIIAIGLIGLVSPDIISLIWTNMQRILFLGQSDTTLTITEAQSMFSENQPPIGRQFWVGYGFTAFTALAGLFWMIVRLVFADRSREEYLLITIWTVFVLLMAMTQVRFHYYLVLAVAVLNGWFVVELLRAISFTSLLDFEDIRTYQALTIITVVMVLLVPIAGPLAITTASAQAERAGPGAVTNWHGGLDWMNENTPEPGEYGGEDNSIGYYGPFDAIDDYEYPEGAYGVMSWWDYGHWITIEAERIPNANPFQQGPRPASAFLLAENESHANLLLDALPSNSSVHELSNDELQSTIDSQTPQQQQEETRYVMIDDQMAAGKFPAIATWTGPGRDAYYSQQAFQVAGTEAQLFGTNDRYRDTMLARLYLNDASGLEHYRLVHETGQSAIVSVAQETPEGDLQSTNAINTRLSGQIFTAVQQRPDLHFYNVHEVAAVKTYERVPGATLAGQADTDNETTVVAAVDLRTNADRNFTYVQTTQTDADGSFELTVPYATTDEVGPADGGTDAGVEATGDYRVFAGNPLQPTEQGAVAVPELAIYDGETVTVDLEAVEPPEEPDGNDTDGNTTDPTGDDGADGNESTSPSLDRPGLSSTHQSPLVAAPRVGAR